jgi:hypothetical protein
LGFQRALAPQPPPATDLDAIVEALEELQLSAPEVHAPGRDRLLDFDFGRLEHQLAIYLGPTRPGRTLHNLFSFVNTMTQLTGGEPLSSDIFTRSASMAFPFGLRNAAQVAERHMARRVHSPPTDSSKLLYIH